MIVLDVETTGTHPERHCVLSLGAVDYQTGKTFYGECCIYHDSLVDPVALEINGFRLHEIQPGLKQWPHQLYAQFLNWAACIPDKVLAGHNIGHFDILFLEVLHKKLNAQWHPLSQDLPWPFGYRTVDLHTLAYVRFGESLSHEKICERLGLVPESKPHGALRGAISERDAFKALLEGQFPQQ